MKRIISPILIALAALSLAVPAAGHEPSTYAEDFYPVGVHQASTQQTCHDEHGTVIHALTAGAAGSYQFNMGHVDEWYLGSIVLAPWEGQLKGNTLYWWPNQVGDRIVVLWTGSPCLIALPMITEALDDVKVPIIVR